MTQKAAFKSGKKKTATKIARTPGKLAKTVKKVVSAKASVKISALAKPAKLKHLADGVSRLTLGNGMKVLILENHKSPVVSVQMWVKTGSADEKKGEEGISHFIEHLVFKGTDKYKVGEIASTVEASGGELNAYTSFDQTVFYVNISREFSDVALDTISEMMGFPKFDATEIDNEREVVIEEIKRGNDSPSRQASRLLFSSVFKSHPYGIPVIGYEKLIQKVSRKTLVDYYHSRYIPTNMHLVVGGDFETEVMAEQINKAFGRFNTFKLRKVSRQKEPAQKDVRIKVQQMAFEEAQFHMAWRVPAADHKDTAALDVLAMIFGQGESSRLWHKLRMEQPLTNSIGCGTFTPKDGGIFTISGSLPLEQMQPAFEALMNEIEILLSTLPTREELARSVTNMESEEFYAMETIEGLARKAGSFENLMGDYAYFQKFLKQVYALKPEDITRVARKYMNPKTMTIVMTVPREEKQAEKALKAWAKSFGKMQSAAIRRKLIAAKGKHSVKKTQIRTPSAGASALKIEKHVLKSGATVIFAPSAATPVFSAKAAYLGGIRVEDPKAAGAIELLSRVWTTGTKTMNELEIQTKVENLAGGLGAFSGRNSAGLSLQGLSPFEGALRGMFCELLTQPEMSETAMEREKTLMLETLKSREDNPSQLVSEAFIKAMFKGHPYERDLYGTVDSVKSLTMSDVDAHLGKMAQAKNLMIVVAGDVQPDQWLKDLEKATEFLPNGQALKNSFPHQGPKQNLTQFKKLDREQSHIIIGYKGLTLSDPRRYTLQIIQSILAGQGGRLFLELRDKASLAYTVSPMRMEGIDTGYFGAYIGCSPAKGTKAIEMLQVEFQKLVDNSVGDVELERAKRYLIGRHDIDLQRVSAIGSSILFNEIYGVSSNELFEYADRLRQVTAKDVQTLSKLIFEQNHVLCAVGATQPW